MAINSSQLLKLLEPAVRPGVGSSIAAGGKAPIDQQSFEDLLAKASAGEVHSGRQIEASLDLQPPLQAGQLERIAVAADQAEAAGAKKALVLVDGRAFTLDVDSRTLTSEISGQSDIGVLKIDCAVIARGLLADQRAAKALIPGTGLASAGANSLLPAGLGKGFASQKRSDAATTASAA